MSARKPTHISKSDASKWSGKRLKPSRGVSRTADECRTRDRAARDRQEAEGHERITTGDESLVMAERKRRDKEIVHARERQDSNLRRERRENQLLRMREALLSAERSRTNKSLGHETGGARTLPLNSRCSILPQNKCATRAPEKSQQTASWPWE